VVNLKRLNGWQRLWVVLSVVWLVTCVVLIIQDASRETLRLDRQLDTALAERRSEWVYTSIQTVWADPSTQPDPSLGFVPDADQSSALEAVRNKDSDLDDVAFVERYQKSYPEVDFGQVNADYEQAVAGLQLKHQQDATEMRLEGIGGVLVLWVIPSGLVYLFAWGGWRVVVWVWRGFKSEGE